MRPAAAEHGSPGRVGPDVLLEALGEDLPAGRAAEVYAAVGLPVLPLFGPAPGGRCTCADIACERPGKHPRVRGGVHAATTDPAVVRRWWRRWLDANVGLATGVVFDVCDVDGPEGVEALRAILSDAGGLAPGGPAARTGGGGWHLVFAPSGLGNRSRFAPGLDWRSHGGYIVAPPSRHPSGNCYRWVRPLGGELPAVPAALRARLEPPRPATRPPVGPVRAASRWVAAALQAEAQQVATTAKGGRGRTGRNHALNRAAFKLGQLVAAGTLDPDEVTHVLLEAALESGLGEREAARTIAYGLAAGIDKPRATARLPTRGARR